MTRYIVAPRKGIRLSAAAGILGGKHIEDLPFIRDGLVELTDAEAEDLRAQGWVLEPDDEETYGVPPFPVTTRAAYQPPELDPTTGGSMNQMLMTGVEALHAKGILGEGIIVGLADTGFDTMHLDLAGKCVGYYDLLEPDHLAYDPHGHGTGCASIALGTGAIVPKFHGVAPGARCRIARVLKPNGYGRTSTIIRGFDRLVREGVDVLSVSLASTNPAYTAMSRTLDAIVEQGTPVVVCASNWGPDGQITAPCNSHRVLTVSSCNYLSQWSSFSSIGPAIGRDGKPYPSPDLMAWGEDVAVARGCDANMGSMLGDWHCRVSGTSFSAPFIAGCFALLRGAGMAADDVWAALMGSAEPTAYVHERAGWGRVDVLAAYEDEYEPIPLPKPPKSTLCTKVGIGWGVPLIEHI